MDNTVDYTNEGFTIPIERNNVRGYASVHAMLCREEDGLEVTGYYFVYLLHPVIGSTYFSLEPMHGKVRPWKREGGDIRLDAETVQEIITQIELRKSKSQVS